MVYIIYKIVVQLDHVYFFRDIRLRYYILAEVNWNTTTVQSKLSFWAGSKHTHTYTNTQAEKKTTEINGNSKQRDGPKRTSLST